MADTECCVLQQRFRVRLRVHVPEYFWLPYTSGLEVVIFTSTDHNDASWVLTVIMINL